MADELQAVVQRMIDAGESEENIATVIQHYQPKYTPDATMTGAATRAIARNAGGVGIGMPAKTDELGNALEQPNPLVKAVVGNSALQSLAHPISLSDVAALLVPNSMGAGETSVSSLARGTMRMLKRGGQAAADGSYAGMPMRFMRGAMAELKRPMNVEPFAPNVSGASAPFVADAEKLGQWDASLNAAPKGIPQGVYAQLPDGSWGVKALPGHQLAEGEAVNIMSRSGVPKVVKVGEVGPDGLAALEGGKLPAAPVSIGGVNVTDPKVLELVRQRLSGK